MGEKSIFSDFFYFRFSFAKIFSMPPENRFFGNRSAEDSDFLVLVNNFFFLFSLAIFCMLISSINIFYIFYIYFYIMIFCGKLKINLPLNVMY